MPTAHESVCTICEICDHLICDPEILDSICVISFNIADKLPV